jgi:hypothetical protein
MPETALTASSVDDHRETIIRQLSDHFAVGHLEVDDLESRLERAHDAATVAALDELVADLEPLPADARYAVALAEDVPAHGGVYALMGGAARTGVWTVPRQMRAVAIMGGAELDFRQAIFGAGATEVWVLALMGGVDVIVPPGVEVECEGVGIAGGFEDRSGEGDDPGPDAPILRIRGAAIFGGVDVETRLVGESNRQARKRRRLERKKATALLESGST